MRNDPLKILVIGCGSIGRRHIRLLKEMGVEVVGAEAGIQAADKAMNELGITVWSCVEWPVKDMFGHGPVDGAIIATPNHLHREPAEEVLRARLPMLIEKPMFHTLHEAETFELLHRVYPDVPLMVGYCLRYHPGLRRLKQHLDEGDIGTVRHASIHFGSYLPDWRPGFDYRQGYAARRETGGGILMDASHELDYACWFFGEPVSVMAQVQNTWALEIETEDVADLVVRFESGVQVNIHLDYLNRSYSRGCQVTGDQGTINWAMDTKAAMSRVMTSIDGETRPETSPFDPDDMYRAELQHFLACIRGEEQPLVTGADGVRAIRLVEAARRSSEEGRVVFL